MNNISSNIKETQQVPSKTPPPPPAKHIKTHHIKLLKPVKKENFKYNQRKKDIYVL